MAGKAHKIAVFPMERDDYGPGAAPIGFVDNKAQAVRLIRKYLAETAGDGDSSISAEFIVYSPIIHGYFIEQ